MKLYYLIGYGYPRINAASLQITRMCNSFQKVGMSTSLVRPFSLTNQSVTSFYGIRRRFANIFIPGIHLWKKIPFVSNLIFFISIIAFTLVIFCRKKSKQSIIYGRNPNKPPLLFVIWLRQMLGRKNPKIFCEIHEGRLVDNPKIADQVDGIVVITKALKQYIINKGIPASKVLLAPDGVDIEEYNKLLYCDKDQLKAKIGLPKGKKLIVYTGHLYADRGLELLIDALTYLDNDIYLVLVGGYRRDIDRIKKAVMNKNLEERVFVTGHKKPYLIPLYQVCADILVAPYSTRWRIQDWSSPLKLFEYMATKKPIIATDFKSLKEILTHNKNSILVEPDNARAIASGIRKILSDEKLANRIAEQAFQDVQEFSWDKRASRILNFMMNRIESTLVSNKNSMADH